MTKHNRIVSGIRATGGLLFGNYIGAVENWLRMVDGFRRHPPSRASASLFRLNSL